MTPDRQPPEVLLADYEARCALLADLGKVVETALKGLLDAKELRFHSVVHRIKEKPSAARKLTEKGTEYGDLDDMHDILGVRIITFFPDEVDRVAQVVTEEFEIDHGNSIDKRATLDPDRFGYLSLHYVAKLGADRMALTEHERFDGLPFEIQIRSILQHAWAEIEHDLGYKTGSSIPPDSRRRFSRLAGLLEIADDEFRAIRDELAEYRRTVPEALELEPAAVDINRDSVLALVERDPVLKSLDGGLSEMTGRDPAPLVHSAADAWSAGLRQAGFTSMQAVAERLRESKTLILRYVHEMGEDLTPTTFYAGAALVLLGEVEVARSGSVDSLRAFLLSLGIPPSLVPRRNPEAMLAAFRRASAKE